MIIKRQVFLLATDILSENIFDMYRKLQQATSQFGDVWILLHQKDDSLPIQPENVNIHTFTDSILHDLNYTPITKSLIPGSNHFSLLHYFLNNPPFDFYWYIENDAVFNGDWQFFFNAFSELKADMISSQIELYKNKPIWYWWHTLQHPTKNVPVEDRLCSFNPVYRLSFTALSFIHEALLDNWSGHHEVVLPTLLHNNNFTIMDFGGKGYFAPPGFKNRFYSWETFRWRPVFKTVGILKNKLYHPVK